MDVQDIISDSNTHIHQVINLFDVLRSTDSKYQQEKLKPLFLDYHTRIGSNNCLCAGVTTKNAHEYHMDFFCGCIVTYCKMLTIDAIFHGPKDFSHLDQLPTDEQVLALFPNQNILADLQEMLLNDY